MYKLSKKERQLLWEKVYNRETRYEMGYTGEEITALLNEYKGISLKEFNMKYGINTVTMVEGNTVYFHSDVHITLLCILENREMYEHEWD
jgi:hypothetical protein